MKNLNLTVKQNSMAFRLFEEPDLYKFSFLDNPYVMLKFKLTPIWISFLIPLAVFSNSETLVFESRDEIPAQYKWDLSVFYSSWEDWQVDLDKMEALYDEMASYKGRLAEGPETMATVLKISEEAGKVANKVFGYAFQFMDLDTRVNEVQARIGELMSVYQRLGTKLSWIDPEILTIPEATMRQWIDSIPELEPHRFGIMDTYRTGKYILNEDGEKLLSLHGIVRRTASDIFDSLTNADAERPEVTLVSGETIKVTPGLYQKALNIYEDPEDRRAIQQAWMEQYKNRSNTFASIYNGVLQQGWALAQSRGYESTLQMELNGDNIPEEVVTSLVAAARSGSAELQRFHNLRKKFLGLDHYGWSDMHVTLVPHDADYPYDDIVPVVVDAVAPLGEEYHSKIAEQFRAGFVDVYETPGKQSGAYNTGRYGVGSFVLLNYQGTLEDVFTVAHEMGHSMHTRLSQEYQPYPTHRYTIFVAEVASTLNEKLLLKKLLPTINNHKERIALVEKQLEAITGTFFLQTMMADFEFQAHQLVEQGQGITADRLTSLWRETVTAYFGDVIPEEDPYMYSWARIPHIYNSPFYVYKYATSLAASSSIMRQMQEDPSTVDRFLELLKSGGNDYPMNQLRKAGVDLANPEVLKAVVEEFSQLVDLLETEYTLYLQSQEIEKPA
ncbi:MAG TPA: oligoendopeptidase F [Oceanipulchritudo sp.]|nr:oligoendopeptidase F [Oceanipulchritudo sp.]